MLYKIKRLPLLILLLCAVTVLPACGAGPAGKTSMENSSPSGASQTTELTVSAAASLTDALKDIQKLYEAKNPVKLNYNFGASGSLQQQIEQGAPVDLFISASVQNMNHLVAKGLVEAGKQHNLVTNELVLVVPADGRVSIGKPEDLVKDRITKIAIGQPATVPAGGYAKEALAKLKLWDMLQPKTVLTKDVRQVLTYVESGNTDAGFVYRTDAFGSSKVKVALTVDPALYSPIEYPAGQIKDTKHPKETQALYDYLQSKEALDVFVRYGFALPKQTN
ncbi:MAG: molybdenum transporter substrate-binding protein [Paenibacillus sp.]|jgi:molybdate transport system substrate-binding protein|nr:molybdenum transporter substrate-binding protein [Paenibacillus sp.]